MKNYYFWRNQIEVAKESTFLCLGDLLHTRIAVRGINNCLNISGKTKVTNYDIVIKGNDNILEIEDNCVANGNHTSLTIGNEEDF